MEANRNRIESIRTSGNELIENDHYAKDTIRSVCRSKLCASFVVSGEVGVGLGVVPVSFASFTVCVVF